MHREQKPLVTRYRECMWRRKAVLGMRLSLKTVASLKSMDIRKEYGVALLARLTESPPAFSFSHTATQNLVNIIESST